tara:strand:+ start:752 stop:1057 length:306 start_codon:yes stop_codon:yes gene_type:complete
MSKWFWDYFCAILESEHYKNALTEFNSIFDRPICIFLYKDDELLLRDRIKVMDYENGCDLQEEGKGAVLVVRMNKIVKVRKIDTCEGCGCSPCDCDWGNHE